MTRVIRPSKSWTRVLKSLGKLSAFLILLLLPVASHGAQTYTLAETLTQTSATPFLRAGDTWHYHYSGPERDSTEQILRNDTCGAVQCVVDQEKNSAWDDTVWLNRDWNLSREYYVDHTTPFNSSSLYTPALHLYQFPLQTGESWWWNSTVSGWYKDPSGNHTETGKLSVLRKVINETTVTVPAGTYDTFLVARYVKNGTLLDQYRWFSILAKTSVKWEVLDTSTNAVLNSYVMTSYSLATPPSPSPAPSPNPSPQPNPSPTTSNPAFLGLSPTLFYSIVGALLAAIVVAVWVVAFSKRRRTTIEIQANSPK